MATSGSTDWNLTRDEICKRALRICGHLDPNETPPAHDITTAAEALNAMLKSWNSTVMGFQLFTQKHCTLFLSKNKHEYKLGPSGDHATASFTSVAVQATANSGDLKVVLPVSSATINQYIGLVDANADLTWRSITATQSASGTIQLSASLTATVSVSNNAYLYTSKIERPVDVIYCYLRDAQNDDKDMFHMDREEYFSRYEKDRDGEPQRWYYEPVLTNGTYYIDFETDDVTENIRIIYRRPFEDFDASTDNPDLPQELIRAVAWNLASEIGPEYGVPQERQNTIDRKALETFLEIRGMYNDSPRRSMPTIL
jgi:hypothetical protein